MSWFVFRSLLRSFSRLPARTASRRQTPIDSEGCEVRTEYLESRVVPSALTIRFDYSMDTNDFFDTQEKRDLLQSVADLYAERISDDLLRIMPSGRNTWSAIFTNPGTGAQASIRNLEVPADTIIIYVGGRDLTGDTLAIGGPGGYSSSGSSSWLAIVDRRGQTGALGNHPNDFGPWGGSVTFDSVGTEWYFGSDPPDGSTEAYDFMSVAMHEIGHVLGFGTSDSFDELISNSSFLGQKSRNVFDANGNPGLSNDVSHWAAGTTEDGHEAAMDPDIPPGVRKLFTELDWAGLDDLGWQTAPIILPTITNPGEISTFVRGGGAVSVDSAATFSNLDGLRLAGSRLVVAVTQNAGAYDFLSIKTGGGITKSGASLKFNGVTIGSYSNGTATKPFKLTFNSKATAAAVEACLRNLTFTTLSRKAGTLDRTVTTALLNAEGYNSLPVHKTVRVA